MELEKGFYYHFKHDSTKGVNDHAYYVFGLGLLTEDDSVAVIYRPLYENDFLGDAEYCIRPYTMFIETVEREGKTFPRFQKITDPAIIEELEKHKNDPN